jgi:hypothetical protein
MVVLRRGDHTVEEVARALPAHKATVYRLINGETRKPSHALRAAVERAVSQARRSDGDPADE